MDFPQLVPNLDLHINHRYWAEALSHSFTLLSMADPGEVICITGPSRIGKSRLIKELSNLLTDPSLNNDYKTVLTVRAANTGPNGTFSSKAFMFRALQNLDHPIFSDSQTGFVPTWFETKYSRTPESIFRHALEEALNRRKTRFLVIDEAQHVRYVGRDIMASSAVMDSWKCLAEDTGVVLVVVGAYPILDILQASPHMIGRKSQVHLPRYGVDFAELEEFAWMVSHFDDLIVRDSSLSSFTDSLELLHKGSQGCIGLLKAWMKRVCAYSINTQKPVTKVTLEQQALSTNDWTQIAKEIERGERNLQKDLDSKRNALTSTSRRNKPKNKPFQRAPKRAKEGNRGGGQ